MQANNSSDDRDDDPAENIENLLHDAIRNVETAFDELPPNEHVEDARLNAGNAEGKIQDAIQLLNEARDLSSEAARDTGNVDDRFGAADRSLDEARSMLDIARDELDRLQALKTPTATVTIQMGANNIAFEVEPTIPTDNREAVMNLVAHTVASSLSRNPALGKRNATMSGGEIPSNLSWPTVKGAPAFPFHDNAPVASHPAIDHSTGEALREAGYGEISDVRIHTIPTMLDDGVPEDAARAAKLVYGGATE